jgi:FixJ family two-component response regulator
MMNSAPVVYVVDDDPSMRRALYRTITAGGWEVQSYASGEEFLAAYDPSRPGCVVLDLRMPNMSGLTVQEHLARREALLPVIFITAFGEIQVAVEAMKKGAIDFLEKPFSNQQLLTCIEQSLNANVRALQAQHVCEERKGRLARLTPREREVMQLLLEGCSNKVVAAELGLHIRTVEVHRQKIMRKMGVCSLVELFRDVALPPAPAGHEVR